MTNQQIESATLFYQTITFSYPCTITLEEYLALCENCPDGYEQSLKQTYKPCQFHFSNKAVVNAVLNKLLVVEPVLLFETVKTCNTCDQDGICTSKCLSQPCKPEGATKCLPEKSTTKEHRGTLLLSSRSTRIPLSNSITTRNW
ncbi:hypothetical protein [Paraglaciecola sp.]|uniref:hypothetical protein n=1 Tax=Paraglaciecola sp. TaxID=1920173 RepID=UPI0030F3B3AB